ncbi:craniofacial development protein 2-like [Palaemon carinicauda]|uniref:craniofacial development protein 2-like n=1 Tax=Palaemon carinicauda TaxID=392227 RepID=UPI0035B65698
MREIIVNSAGTSQFVPQNVTTCHDKFVAKSQASDSGEERKVEYYEELQRLIGEIPERDMRIVIGDINAEVGRNDRAIEDVMGVEGFGDVANGKDFMSFRSANNFVLGGTLFQHKNILKYTWTSPCSNYKMQIYHIAIIKQKKDAEKCEKL